jgi:hypothetical protein
MRNELPDEMREKCCLPLTQNLELRTQNFLPVPPVSRGYSATRMGLAG